jgi:hypothetical protein
MEDKSIQFAKKPNKFNICRMNDVTREPISCKLRGKVFFSFFSLIKRKADDDGRDKNTHTDEVKPEISFCFDFFQAASICVSYI